MEPMNLGTPSNSGPSSPATTPSGSPYLPSFLLGEPASPLPGSTSPQIKRGNISDFQNYTSPRFLASQVGAKSLCLVRFNGARLMTVVLAKKP